MEEIILKKISNTHNSTQSYELKIKYILKRKGAKQKYNLKLGESMLCIVYIYQYVVCMYLKTYLIICSTLHLHVLYVILNPNLLLYVIQRIQCLFLYIFLEIIFSFFYAYEILNRLQWNHFSEKIQQQK